MDLLESHFSPCDGFSIVSKLRSLKGIFHIYFQRYIRENMILSTYGRHIKSVIIKVGPDEFLNRDILVLIEYLAVRPLRRP